MARAARGGYFGTTTMLLPGAGIARGLITPREPCGRWGGFTRMRGSIPACGTITEGGPGGEGRGGSTAPGEADCAEASAGHTTSPSKAIRGPTDGGREFVLRMCLVPPAGGSSLRGRTLAR